MTFDGALIREQGVEFALVVVKKRVTDNQFEARKTQQSFQPCFPGVPIVLVSQDHRGVPTYYGRPDIAKFMSCVPFQNIPWKEFSYN